MGRELFKKYLLPPTHFSVFIHLAYPTLASLYVSIDRTLMTKKFKLNILFCFKSVALVCGFSCLAVCNALKEKISDPSTCGTLPGGNSAPGYICIKMGRLLMKLTRTFDKSFAL